MRSEIVFRVRVRAGLVADLIAMRNTACASRQTSMESFISEVLESEIASFRLKKSAPANVGLPLRSRVSIADSRRRGLAPDVIRRVENLQYVVPVAKIARRLRISRSSVLRIIRAARRREQHNR